MTPIHLPGTDLRISRLAFGTGSLHHLFGASARQALLATAAEHSLTHFDTAPYYGYGLAEEDLGVFLRGRRDAFTVATKVGLHPHGPAARHAAEVWARKALGKLLPQAAAPRADWGVASARASLRASLRRLRTDHVDLLLLHEPAPAATDPEGLLAWLAEERRLGTIRAWGIAGLEEHVSPLLARVPALGQVVQTRDTLGGREARFLEALGRPLQLTYGYLGAGLAAAPEASVTELLRQALVQNPTGAVIVSTRQPERLKALAEAMA